MDHVVPPVINVAHKSRFDTISSSGPFNIITVIAVIVIAAVGFWLWRKWQAKSVKRTKSHVSFAKPVSQMAVARGGRQLKGGVTFSVKKEFLFLFFSQ